MNAHSIVILAIAIVASSPLHASDSASRPSTKPQTKPPVCAENKSPYRDLDFLVGHWDFYTQDGKKFANQVYTKKEEGCLILEDWSTITGETGTGMNFVDPATGKWRQVWMSARFHIDYSGGLTEKGDFVLACLLSPPPGDPATPVKGIYSRQADGSVVKEFLQYDEAAKSWRRLFIGTARRQAQEANQTLGAQ